MKRIALFLGALLLSAQCFAQVIGGNGMGGGGGGFKCSPASGTCLDTLTGFASTGFMSRTGAGAYSFTASTGTGSVVLSTSPSLTSPNLGTPTAITLTNGTGLPVSTGLTGTGTGVVTALGQAVNGSGGIVETISPTITTPTISGTITSYNGVTTAAGGVPVIVAKYDATAQSANVSTSTVLYAVPAGGMGTYWVRPMIVVTQAASGGTPSSTMPEVQCGYTDNDTNTTQTIYLGATATTNTVGTLTQSAGATMRVKASTNITCGTAGYASAGTTAMQFAVHLDLFYAGN